MEFSPRQHCATCVHIAHVTTPTRAFFRCQRLGWETKPQYQFSCWVERPRHDKMSRLIEPDPDVGGSSPA